MMRAFIVQSPLGRGRNMARSRHQNGSVCEMGRAVRKWVGTYYVYERQADGAEIRRCRRVRLGDRARMKKWEAEKALRKMIEAATGQAAPAADLTLAWFWRERYWPMKHAGLKPSSREIIQLVLNRHIIPVLGPRSLPEISRYDCQMLVNGIAAAGYGASMIHKVRVYLKAVLDEAMEQGYLSSNPARKLDIPRTRAVEKPVLTVKQAARLLAALQPPDSLILRMALQCGLRPGELFALRWNDWQPGRMRIDEAVWRGRIDSPKTVGSSAWMPVPCGLESGLRAWKERCRSALNGPHPWRAEDDSLHIFPERDLEWHPGPDLVRPVSRPMDKRSWLDERLRPVATLLGIQAVDYRILRRTFATLAQKCGTVKDAQRLLRHASPNLTVGVYMQEIESSVRLAADNLEGLFSK